MNSSWLLIGWQWPKAGTLNTFIFVKGFTQGPRKHLVLTTSSRTRPCLLHKSKPQRGTPGSGTGGEEEPRGLLVDFC